MKTFLNFSRSFNALVSVLIFTALLAVTPKANAQSSDLPADVRKDIEALNHRIEESIQKKDLPSIIDLYSDDATIIAPGGKKIQGRKAIAEYWFGLGQATSLKNEIVELGGNGKIIYQVGRWTITSIKDGKEQVVSTDIVLVWKRLNYDYKIQLTSSNNPVAALSAKNAEYEAVKPN